MAETKEFFTRIMQKHDTEANWALKTNFIPLNGEIIIYDKDSTHNYIRVKIGDGVTKINNLPFTLTAASGTQAGITIVYPAASCTTFSSDSGTVTPLAVQKGAKMFAITRPTSSTVNAITRYSNTTGDVKDSKIKIEDVTNTRDTSKTAQVIAIPAEGGKKMVYGYCTDQVDGTSFIGGIFDANATSYPYNQGLAIGGTSGNLLWKGKRVLDAADLTSINTAIDGVVYSGNAEETVSTTINADTLGGFEPAYFKNATTLNGKTEETIITNVLKKIYPVGAIYSSMTSTNPATLFGFGTWIRIEGKFLLGANSTYAAGTSGGEATHTLTINEIPWHDHSVRVDWHDTAAKTNTAVAGSTPITANSSYSGNLAIDRSGGQGTEGTGGSQSHNNMPPYLAVYMWQRTA